MKNKLPILLLIILLSVIIIALIVILVFSINGRINISNGKINLGKVSEEIVLDEKFDISDILNLEITSKSGNITFKASEENKLRLVAYGQDRNDIKIDLEGSKLSIDYSKYRTSWFGSYRNDMIIYIPEDYSNHIKIKNDYGECKIIDLENTEIDLDCDCGNVELGKIKDAKIKCDYGNIEIESIMNSCDLRADCGNIKIREANINENSTIRADLGNIIVEKINNIHVDADVDLGKAKIYTDNKESNVTLKIRCDMGNITVGEK